MKYKVVFPAAIDVKYPLVIVHLTEGMDGEQLEEGKWMDSLLLDDATEDKIQEVALRLMANFKRQAEEDQEIVAKMPSLQSKLNDLKPKFDEEIHVNNEDIDISTP